VRGWDFFETWSISNRRSRSRRAAASRSRGDALQTRRPAQAAVKITLPSLYGVLNATGGTVKVTEADGWRNIELKEILVAGTRDSGKLNATLTCGM